MNSTHHAPTPHPTVRLAMLEMNSQVDILANLQAIEAGTQQAIREQAKLVVLPENAFCFGNQPLAAQYFEPLTDWCGELAKRYNVHLVAGTLPCPHRPDGSPVTAGKFRQSSLLFDPTGVCIARYDKLHLFRATVSDSTGSYDEGRIFEAGDLPVIGRTPFGNIGLMVCFDLRFPALALKLRAMGADILTAPSAFTYHTGKAHWHALLTARALDSQCLIIAAAQAGSHTMPDGKPPRQTWGHSLFMSATGNPLGDSLALDNRDIDFTLSTAAQAWLPKPASFDKPVQPCPVSYRVLLADFDPTEQQHARQAIDLAASQRFSIHL